MSLLNLSKSFSFLIQSGKPFQVFGEARVLQNNAHITLQVIARTSCNMYEIT